VFSRFVTATRPEAARGHWQIYYRHWNALTLAKLPPGFLDLIPELAAIARPGNVLEKFAHSCFDTPEFEKALDRLEAQTLIVTGCETDVCVLATVLDAVDRGLRVILIEDAVTSSSIEGHRAALDHIYPRYDQQIEVLDAEALLRAWE
jgi:nicotinamidase-related amidase